MSNPASGIRDREADSNNDDNAIEYEYLIKYQAENQQLVQEYDCYGDAKLDIGVLDQLPSAPSNYIYRMSVPSNSKKCVAVRMVPETCVGGKCPYGDLCNITPGLITAYQQSRGEVASIPFPENREFKFHNDVVQQACIPQWLRAVGDHMLDIPSLEFVVKRDMLLLESGSFIQVVTHTIQLVLPEKHTFYGDFKMFAIAEAEDSTPRGAICVCDLQALVSDINRKKEALIHTDDMFDPYIPLLVVPVGEYVVAFAEAEAFKDFVVRLRSNVSNETDLGRCTSCREVVVKG